METNGFGSGLGSPSQPGGGSPASAAPVLTIPTDMRGVPPQGPVMTPRTPTPTAGPKAVPTLTISESIDPKVDRITSIIAPGVRVVGRIETNEGILIKGEVDGGVILVDKDGAPAGTVIVAEDARVKGVVCGARVIIQGTVDGGVVARQHLGLAETAVVTGEIHYARMAQAEGAEMEGSVTKIREGKDPTNDVIARLAKA